MMVIYDKVKRGWVDSAFDGINEYWVCNAITKELVFQAFSAGDVRSFRKEELTFTGEWSRAVESEAVVQIPPEVVDIIVETEDWESTWEEKTKVVLQIEHLVSGAPGRILIGPGFPPDVKAAERMLSDHVRELIRSQDITETLDVSSDILEKIQSEENWEAEWEEQVDVRVRVEALEDGLGRIAVGPGSGSVVTKAVALLSLHVQELGESRDREGLGDDPGEITSEDLQQQLEKLKKEQEEEEARAAAEAEAFKARAAEEEQQQQQQPWEDEAMVVEEEADDAWGSWGNESGEVDTRTPPPKALAPVVVPPRRPVQPVLPKAAMSAPPALPVLSKASYAPPVRGPTPQNVPANLAAVQSKAAPATLKDRLVAVSSISQASAVVQAARARLAALDAGAGEAGAEPEAQAHEAVDPGADATADAGKAEAEAAAADAEPAAAAEPPAADAEPATDAEPAADAAKEAAAAEGAEPAPQAAGEAGGAATAASAVAPAEGAGEAGAAEASAAAEAAPGGGAEASAEAPAGEAPGAGAGGEAAAEGGEEGQTIEYWMQNQAQFAHLAPLPPNWIRVKSKSMGYIYYVNLRDGATTLQEPGKEQAPLPPGWTEVTSRSTGQVYYWHSATGHSQFIRPIG